MKSISRGYSLNECPSVKESIPLSIQHVLVLIFNVLPVPLLIGAGVGLSAAEITILIAGCMFVTGAATLLQTIGAGPVGAKLPIPLENSFVFVAPGIALGAQYGLNSFTGACLVGSAITCLVWIAFHKQLQILFKPYIAGAVVMSLGLSLIGVGINYCAGGVGAPDFGSPINLGLALGTILIMLLLNHYCRKNFLSKASPLIAIIIMSMAAAAAGKLDLSSVMDEAWFRLPRILHFGIKFEMGPVITVTVLAIFALVELIGDQSSAAMLAKGELPTSEETKGGVLAQGISSVAGALFNMCPTISGSANIGLWSFRSYKPLYYSYGWRRGALMWILPQAVCSFRGNSVSGYRRRGPLCFWNHCGIRNERNQIREPYSSYHNDCRGIHSYRRRLFGCAGCAGASAFMGLHPVQRCPGDGNCGDGAEHFVEGKR